MNTIVVWILVLSFGEGNYGGSTQVIDNISSEENCRGVAAQIIEHFSGTYDSIGHWKCIKVRKAK